MNNSELATLVEKLEDLEAVDDLYSTDDVDDVVRRIMRSQNAIKNAIRNVRKRLNKLEAKNDIRTSSPSTDDRNFLYTDEVIDMVGLSRTTIDNRVNPNHPNYDPLFPLPVKNGHKKIWKKTEVQAWLDSLLGV